ncbi:MAG: hypothetical protein ABIR24_08650 [Verrucomicrobiota bacterium]
MISAKSIAQKYLAKLNLPSRLDGATIQLADYKSDSDLKFLKGADEWSLEFHREVNRFFGDALRERGAKVVAVVVTMKDYFSWLAKFDLKNTTENRAQFISWSTAPEPKLMPIR